MSVSVAAKMMRDERKPEAGPIQQFGPFVAVADLKAATRPQDDYAQKLALWASWLRTIEDGWRQIPRAPEDPAIRDAKEALRQAAYRMWKGQTCVTLPDGRVIPQGAYVDDGGARND
jgi:hypothetical protein